MRYRPIAAVAVSALISCSPGSIVPAVSTSDAVCAGPTPLTTVAATEGPGAMLGPVLLRGFEPGSADATIRNWHFGTYQKVLILRVEPSPELTIRGRRCSDGHALRFWYGGSPLPIGPNGSPIPTDDFDALGSDPLRLPSFDGTAYALGVPGYMLFTADGDWLIQVSDKDKALGSAVLRVTMAP